MAALPLSWVPWVDALGWTLLHFLWQGAVVGAAYALLRHALRTVAGRYHLGMGALLILMLCPVATFLWLLPAAHSAANVVAMAPIAAVLSSAVAEGSAWRLEAALPWLVALWLLCVCGIAGRAFLHWRRLHWLVRHAASPLPEFRDSLEKLCRRFGIRRPVQLLTSLRVATPMLIGWLRPVILLPASMLSGFTPNQIELIIAHELGHIRRWDYLANLMQVIVETVLFYHPVVHWISREVRDARESCCDDLVLTLGDGSPLAYARALTELESMRNDDVVIAPALGAGGGVLLARIRRIVGLQADSVPGDNGGVILLFAIAVLAAALRMHSLAVPQLPTPAQSLALISGNSGLVAAAGAAAAVPASRPPEVADPQAPIQPPGMEITRIAVPRVSVASPGFAPKTGSRGVERLENLSAPLTMAADNTEPGDAAPALPAGVVAVQIPVATHVVYPTYPTRSLIAGEAGKVDLEFGIAADGSVQNIRVIHGRSRELDEAAAAALREWRFTTEKPIDVSQRYTQTFAFTRASATDTCREATGSHICRRVAD